MRQALVRLSTVLIVGSTLNCTDTTGPGVDPGFLGRLATPATVRFIDVEGGCWRLDTPRGHFEPIGLPAEFRVDGLEVNVSLRSAPDMGSICMIGPMARIDAISAR